LDFRSGSAQALGMLGSGLMCLGYLGWLVAFFKGPGARLGAWLAPAGRMALTNYLMQSVVCTLVFYGYGLGWYGQLPRAWHVPFALVLFVLQVLLAHVWLARFRFGPMEWLWRSATYLRPQPMRLRAQPVAGLSGTAPARRRGRRRCFLAHAPAANLAPLIKERVHGQRRRPTATHGQDRPPRQGCIALAAGRVSGAGCAV